MVFKCLTVLAYERLFSRSSVVLPVSVDLSPFVFCLVVGTDGLRDGERI